MNEFLLYIGRSGLYLSLFYAFFLLVMRHTTLFRFNRIALLAGSALCLVLPLFKFRTVEAVLAQAGELTMVSASEATLQEPVAAVTFPWTTVLAGLYFLGLASELMAILLSSGKMLRLMRRGTEQKLEDCTLVISEEDIPSFSWGRKVVMSRKDLEQNPAILTHERMHVKCRHSLDLLLFSAFQLLFWWNPLVWITRTELKLLHEYEADEGVLQKGIDATQYQLLLVRKSVGEERFTLASGFQHTKLKNRITMMLKNPTSGGMRWAYLALLPVLSLAMFAFNPVKVHAAGVDEENGTPAILEETAISSPQDTTQSVPFQLVEVKPSFRGGDANEFSKWVNETLVYPAEAKKDTIQGRVTLQFIVDVDGSIVDAKVIRSAHPLLDAEALRVVSSCPEKWSPGIQGGKPVRVHYVFPVIFQLK
ncbi:MAG: M56 family metallopeptidase [Bacteroidales bacterium]|nr:M56 family metallopeptidase [Bacteroidales bacterium]